MGASNYSPRSTFHEDAKILDGLSLSGSDPLYPFLGLSETKLLRPSRGPLAAILPLFPRRLQLPIPLGENLLLMPDEHERFLHIQLRQDRIDSLCLDLFHGVARL
jgi:hypothetical protein